MSTLRKILILLLLFLTLHFIILAKVNLDKILNPNAQQQSSGKKIVKTHLLKNDGIGEKLVYDVKLGKIRLGKAQYTHNKSIEIDGKLLNVMTFVTKVANFNDTETIYTDPETFLPVKIERDIVNWFSKEKIIENYDQKKCVLTIEKTVGSKKERLVIKKDTPIHNAILLPQYVRRVAKLDTGRILVANLPKGRYEIRLVSIEEVTVPAGTFKAYHFKTTPEQIEIWISADERRIPVKIKNCDKIGYSLVLKEYTF
ncbi:MAG: DUF3108 domain-containing protein [Candidatus Omnitrophota bacterium]